MMKYRFKYFFLSPQGRSGFRKLSYARGKGLVKNDCVKGERVENRRSRAHLLYGWPLIRENHVKSFINSGLMIVSILKLDIYFKRRKHLKYDLNYRLNPFFDDVRTNLNRIRIILDGIHHSLIQLQKVKMCSKVSSLTPLN